MNRNKKIFIIVIWILIIGLILTPFIYVEGNKFIYKNKVMNYLVEEKGYKEKEIQLVEGVWGVKLPPFFTRVIFENEPYVEYIYFAHDDIIQFEYSLTEEGIQKGITEKDLKNYESSN
ncbi:DUF3139 domain-containing protein [Lottiidibacillus patelloidae]|uniref:DUF3139 domain-containing protein n=1 Tax=Lottiidibacillus patelloidae TaxID=2670334 RepID=UPI001E28C2FD|nr:DUF3139 domain-containing protein [Lottiidibacillus patelloidae]